jgi:hypothetical protein
MIVECFTRIEKWKFVGRGAVLIPHPSQERAEFTQLKATVLAEQTDFLEKSRALDTDDGSKPTHGTVPKSLFTARPQGLGVFADSERYIAWAVIYPAANFTSTARANMRADAIVEGKNARYRLVLVGQIEGAQKIPQLYRIAEDWATAILDH